MRRRIDDRADIGRNQRRVAHDQLGHRTLQHRQQTVGDIVLDIEQAQRGAALPGAVEGRDQNVGDDLLGERRGVDDHRILTAGLGDQRYDGSQATGENEVDLPRGFCRAREGNPCNARIADQRRADRLACPR